MSRKPGHICTLGWGERQARPPPCPNTTGPRSDVARFVAALAQCGHSGTVRIPDDAECERAVREFERYRAELAARFAALAAQRTRDQRRQRAIAEALLRKALSWRHQQESE